MIVTVIIRHTYNFGSS